MRTGPAHTGSNKWLGRGALPPPPPPLQESATAVSRPSDAAAAAAAAFSPAAPRMLLLLLLLLPLLGQRAGSAVRLLPPVMAKPTSSSTCSLCLVPCASTTVKLPPLTRTFLPVSKERTTPAPSTVYLGKEGMGEGSILPPLLPLPPVPAPLPLPLLLPLPPLLSLPLLPVPLLLLDGEACGCGVSPSLPREGSPRLLQAAVARKSPSPLLLCGAAAATPCGEGVLALAASVPGLGTAAAAAAAATAGLLEVGGMGAAAGVAKDAVEGSAVPATLMLAAAAAAAAEAALRAFLLPNGLGRLQPMPQAAMSSASALPWSFFRLQKSPAALCEHYLM